MTLGEFARRLVVLVVNNTDLLISAEKPEKLTISCKIFRFLGVN